MSHCPLCGNLLSTHGKTCPTPEEIAARSAAIKHGWSERERYARGEPRPSHSLPSFKRRRVGLSAIYEER
jgi:hypothetical protein